MTFDGFASFPRFSFSELMAYSKHIGKHVGLMGGGVWVGGCRGGGQTWSEKKRVLNRARREMREWQEKKEKDEMRRKEMMSDQEGVSPEMGIGRRVGESEGECVREEGERKRERREQRKKREKRKTRDEEERGGEGK